MTQTSRSVELYLIFLLKIPKCPVQGGGGGKGKYPTALHELREEDRQKTNSPTAIAFWSSPRVPEVAV